MFCLVVADSFLQVFAVFLVFLMLSLLFLLLLLLLCPLILLLALLCLARVLGKEPKDIQLVPRPGHDSHPRDHQSQPNGARDSDLPSGG